MYFPSVFILPMQIAIFVCDATRYNFIIQGNLGVSERFTVKDGCMLFLEKLKSVSLSISCPVY